MEPDEDAYISDYDIRCNALHMALMVKQASPPSDLIATAEGIYAFLTTGCDRNAEARSH